MSKRTYSEKFDCIFNKNQLVRACERLDVDKVGNKDELITRLIRTGSREGFEIAGLLENAFTAEDLRDACRQIGADAAGNKETLAETLSEVFFEDARSADEIIQDMECEDDSEGDDDDDDEDVKEKLWMLFSKRQLVDGCSRLGLVATGNKDDLIDRLLEYSSEEDLSLSDWMEEAFVTDDLREGCRSIQASTAGGKQELVRRLIESYFKDERSADDIFDAVRDDESVDDGSEESCDASDENEEDECDGESDPEEDVFAGEVGWYLSSYNSEPCSPLLPHQERAMRELGIWWRSSQPPGVLCLPTGAGKTRTAVSFILREALRTHRVLWLAHRTELVEGALETFSECASEAISGFRLSRFESGKLKDPNHGQVVVASIPTLSVLRKNRLINFRSFVNSWRGDSRPVLVVVDECHHGVARTWRNLFGALNHEFPGFRLLGLSATPTRTNEKEVGAFWKIFKDVIHQEQVLDLIREGVLARPRIELIHTGAEATASSRDRDYFQQFHDLSHSLVKELVSAKAFERAVVSAYQANPSRWGQTLVFAANKQHAKSLARAFGSRAKCLISGERSAGERRQLIEGFRNREFPILVNVAICSEGVDVPGINSVFVARPTKSHILLQQMVGRAMRGQKVQGTEVCNVVVFSASVRDLAHDGLQMTYRDQAAIARDLQLDEVIRPSDLQTPKPNAQVVPALPPVGYERRMQELQVALENASFGTARVPVFPNDLIGWHVVASQGEMVCLVAFNEYAEILGRAVGEVRVDGVYGHQAETKFRDVLKDCGVAPNRWEQFCRVYRAAPGSYYFQDLPSSCASDVFKLNMALQATGVALSKQSPVVDHSSGFANASLPPQLPEPSASVSRQQQSNAVGASPLAHWQLAQAICAAGRADEVIIVKIAGAHRPLSKRNWTAVSNVWRSIRGMGANQGYMRYAGNSMLEKERATDAAWLLDFALEHGDLPPVLSVNEVTPSLDAFAREAMRLPPDQRKDALTCGYDAFFGNRFVSREEYLQAVLCAC